ncbi:UNVERIFIED_ORG: hypothetical protein LHJ69_23710 [Shinella sp. XGS7]|nr:hypothetical protein [Shinella sp. XGS7]
MQQAQAIPAVRHLNPVLERLLSTTHMLFRRRISDEPVPPGVESALPGLEVRDSTWEAWEAAEAAVRS